MMNSVIEMMNLFTTGLIVEDDPYGNKEEETGLEEHDYF